MSTNPLYIILPVHNRKIITERFVTGLVSQLMDNSHLILIDDGSVDGTEEMVRGYISDVTVIKGTGNWWWAGCLQHGINWLIKLNIDPNCLVLIINDDVTISREFLGNGVAYLEDKNRTLLLAQVIDDKTKTPVESGVVADLSNHTFKIAGNGEIINCFSTRGLLLKFGDILEIGGFYPTLLPHYGSDYEYTIRAFNKGFSLVTDSSFHLEIDRDETGMHQLPDVNFVGYLLNVFSKRFVGNPIYRSTFICLISPKRRIPILLYNQWEKTFLSIYCKAKHQILLSLINFKAKIIR